MTVEMAVAAERERLEQRVAQLEHEVDLLGKTLADIVHGAVGAVAGDTDVANR